MNVTNLIKIIFSMVSFVTSVSSSADVWVQPPSNVSVGDPVYGGNGCPQGTVRAVFAPDATSFTILFDQLVVSRPGEASTCNVVVPIQIPENYQMLIHDVDIRGFAALPDAQAQGVLSSSHYFEYLGAPPPAVFSQTFAGPLMSDFLVSTANLAGSLPGMRVEGSYCGGLENLHVDTQIQLLSAWSQAQLAVDSIDGPGQATYYVTWKKCLLGSGRFSD